jgi:Kef-type K+ transport system membrane component KefB
MRWHRLLPVAALVWAVPAFASAGGADPVAPVLLAIAVVLVAAKLGGEVATRLGQPAVLGELLAGVLIGNLGLVGFHGLTFIATDPGVDLLARLGVILLLFEVGLESTIVQMMHVGVSALLVAILGVAAPFALGWAVGVWLLPEASVYVHAFLGATLCATSVGITARVLRDLGRSESDEARVILGAAVIDDVLGLVVLAAVTAAIAAADTGATMSLGAVGVIVGKAGAFLVLALGLGVWLSPKLFNVASALRTHGVLLALGLAFCFLLAYVAGAIGLAAIIGAFAAGLILEDLHFKDFIGRGERSLVDLLHPIVGFLSPVFFVLMGMHTDLRAFGQPGIAVMAAALTVAAVLGKQAGSLGVLGRGMDWLSVGLGMVPRGEVGLIFANVGLGLTVAGERVISGAVFSAVVVMVIVTTLVTPPALRWSFGRRSRALSRKT